LTSGNAQLLRPFPQFSNVTWINPSIGSSTYHGGFIRAEKRMSGSLSFLAHYTFSKFLDDVEAANEFGSTGSYMDAYNRRLDKGRSGSDVPQRVVVTMLYEIRKGFLRGWKIGVLETAESGPNVHGDHNGEYNQCVFQPDPCGRTCSTMLGCPPITAP